MGLKRGEKSKNGNYHQEPVHCTVTLDRNKHNLIIGYERETLGLRNISQSLNFLEAFINENRLKLRSSMELGH